MSDRTIERLVQSNLMLIEALAFHRENEQRKIEGNSIAYREDAFYNLINGFHQKQ